MTQKHYDWMTPEEAEMMIDPNEFIWVFNSDINAIFPGSMSDCADILEYNNGDTKHIRICRAIVPEVPSE